MTTEVESYGLEVDPDWTKEEIMEHFEEFLLEGAPEEPSVIEGAPSAEPPPPPPEGVAVADAPLAATTTEVEGGEPIAPPPDYSPPVDDPQVRIMHSPGWGRQPGAKAP